MRLGARRALRRRRDERGAFAILFGPDVMLFTFAALGVDIGNAVARLMDTQDIDGRRGLRSGSQAASNCHQ